MAKSVNKIREFRATIAAGMGEYLRGVIAATQRGALCAGEARAQAVWL